MHVSVSAYQDGDLLAGCLESVRDVLGDVHIQVVDGRFETWPASSDNSTDSTPDVAARYDAEYLRAGPFADYRQKLLYRERVIPADEWVLIIDADERLLAFDDTVLERDAPILPRIANPWVYHDGTPVVYRDRLYKPEWVDDIIKWDEYVYNTPEAVGTDRVTIAHRHDLREREYREAKYEWFEREGRTGRYKLSGKAETYYSNAFPFTTEICPDCGRDSVTRTPATMCQDVERPSRVAVCVADDRCYTEVEYIEDA